MAETDQGTNAIETASKVAEAIEKLSDYRFALHVLPAFFALDVSLLATFGTNVFSTDWAQRAKDSLGFGVCVIVGYIVCMAIAVPVARAVVEPVLRKVADAHEVVCTHVAALIFSSSREYQWVPRERRVKGKRVKLDVVRERALRERDSFWLQLVQAKEAEMRATEKAETSLAILSFATLAFALVDIIGFPGTSILGKTVQQVSVLLGADTVTVGYIAILAVGVVVALPWFMNVFHESDGTDWIEHPALADELIADFKRRQEERVRLMTRY